MEDTVLQVSDAVALINQTLEYAYPTIVIEGEVSSFKVNQNKFVFFDLKDATATLGCFMMVFALRQPLEDGMRVRVVAQPKITQWGKFSLTVREVHPVGEGSLKRAFDLLLLKLDKEGLFEASRKRPLPVMPTRIGVISSTQAAGYADFVKILNQRWGGVEVLVAHTVVQGSSAPPQIIKAIEHFNQMSTPPEVIAIIRGGGSLDDLSAFNDEPLVRAIAGSRVPIITGIGHEIDTSLSDLVADVRASTPSNAAQILVPDRQEIMSRNRDKVYQISSRYTSRLREISNRLVSTNELRARRILQRHERIKVAFEMRLALLRQLDPRVALKRGYSLLRDSRGKIIDSARPGETVTIETKSSKITAGVVTCQPNQKV